MRMLLLTLGSKDTTVRIWDGKSCLHTLQVSIFMVLAVYDPLSCESQDTKARDRLTNFTCFPVI